MNTKIEIHSNNSFYDIVIDLAGNGDNWTDIDSTQEVTLWEIINDSTFTSNNAKSALTIAGKATFEPEILQITGGDDGRIAKDEKKNNKQIESSLKVLPNPTSGYTLISYQISTDSVKAMLILYDVFGKELQHREIKNSTGSISFDLSYLAPGFYYCRLQNDRSELNSIKILITK